MNDYDAFFATLAAAGITVDGCRQTTSGDWEARLGLRYYQGRHIAHIANGPTAYTALANCLSLVQWSILNPPTRLRSIAITGEDLLKELGL